jgi:hypothetical protein
MMFLTVSNPCSVVYWNLIINWKRFIMWVIIGSDGDIDYTDVYGLFGSKDDAEAALARLPEDDGDVAYRTELLKPISDLDDLYV